MAQIFVTQSWDSHLTETGKGKMDHRTSARCPDSTHPRQRLPCVISETSARFSLTCSWKCSWLMHCGRVVPATGQRQRGSHSVSMPEVCAHLVHSEFAKMLICAQLRCGTDMLILFFLNWFFCKNFLAWAVSFKLPCAGDPWVAQQFSACLQPRA